MEEVVGQSHHQQMKVVGRDGEEEEGEEGDDRQIPKVEV